MDSDKLMRGIIPGIIAGYIFLAFVGAGNKVTDVAMGTIGEGDAAVEFVSGVNTGMNMLADVGGMIGADALIGFILHIIISAVVGALYTGIYRDNVDLGNPLYNIAIGGLIYGVIWWILGGLIIMPAIAGNELLQINLNSPSLFGHVIFGHVLAFLVVIRDAALGMGGDE